MRNSATAAAIALAMFAAAPACAGGVAEPDSYRTEQYRAPVPETLSGAIVLDTAAARALWEAGEAVFIDVLPSPPKPSGLPEGTIWQEPARDTIPGATWLPNVGFGVLDPQKDAWFRSWIGRLTDDDPARPVVFFCLSDCWMSWNAARRAVVEYGMSGVRWYPQGTDGWEAAGLPLAQVQAEE